jgi:hypothetical protein
MIDFDSLVLSVAQNTFARPITITPTKSIPGAAPYVARGIWDSKAVDLVMEDSVMVSQDLTLSIRSAEFAVAPMQGDTIELDAYQSLPRIGICAIDRITDDGQGASLLVLKVIAP